MTQIIVVVAGLLVGFVGSRVGRRVRSSSNVRDESPVARRPAGGARPKGSKAAASAAGIGRSVGGALGGRKNLDLPHLQRAAFSELIRHVTTDADGRTAIPTDATILLAPDDHRRVADAERWFCSELSKALISAARDQGWGIPAPPRISVEADPSRARGTPGVRIAGPPVSPGPPPPPRPGPAPADPAGGPATQATPATAAAGGALGGLLTRTDGTTQETHRLTGDAVTIGRGSDRDIRVEESRASRNHGTFRPSRSGPGWTYTDEASSNGTVINGHRIDPNRRTALRDGDVLQIGPTAFTFSTPRPPAPAPAAPDHERTQALDDRQREDLTGAYFPPPADDPQP